MKNKIMTINEVMASPVASKWLKTALGGALDRDPVDMANEAAFLATLLRNRMLEVLKQ